MVTISGRPEEVGLVTEPVPFSSALFGADGTQLPEPYPVLPDPLTGPQRSTWWDALYLAPVALPPAPDPRAIRETMAAVFGEDPVPREQPAGPAPPVHAAPSARAGGPPPPGGGFPGQRPLTGQVGRSPVGRPPVRGPAGARPPHFPGAVPPQALAPLRPADFSRKVDRGLSARRRPTRSYGGAQTGCIIVLIILGLVLINLIAGIFESVSGYFQ
ncbi:MAG: hypothetical protein ABR608_14040 [Pseudonocardiaceae bacterium]